MGRKIAGIILAALSAMGLFALVITLFSSDSDRGITLLMMGFFGAFMALGLLLANLPKRKPRIVKMQPEKPLWPNLVSKPASTPESAPTQEVESTPLSATTPESAPESASATKSASAPEPASAPKSEPMPAPKPKPELKPVPEPFTSYERQNSHTRVFKVLRDQIDLANCPELAEFTVPYDHKVAATIALALRKCGYEMTVLVIGGGSTEVSHTGAVEYSGSYDSLDDFIANAPANYRKAGEKARELYEGWFTGLNWFWINQRCERPGSTVRVNIDCVCSVTLTWESEDWSHFEEEVRTVKRYLCGGSH